MTRAAQMIPFDKLCRAAGLAIPVAEYRFAHAARRQWRFDWAWPAEKVALEVEGGAYTRGRHTRPIGFLNDIEKYNAAQMQGWLVLRTIPARLTQPSTLDLLRAALAQRKAAR